MRWRGLSTRNLPPTCENVPSLSLLFQVLRACDGRAYAGAVQKFLALVLPACGDLSFQQDQMTQTFGFRDTEIT